jgi:hypothetical protein
MSSENHAFTSIINLNEDIFVRLFLMLSPENLLTLFFVSKEFKRIASLELIWEHKNRINFSKQDRPRLPASVNFLSYSKSLSSFRLFARSYMQQYEPIRVREILKPKMIAKSITFVTQFFSAAKECDIDFFLNEENRKTLESSPLFYFFSVTDGFNMTALDWINTKDNHEIRVSPVKNIIYKIISINLNVSQLNLMKAAIECDQPQDQTKELFFSLISKDLENLIFLHKCVVKASSINYLKLLKENEQFLTKIEQLILDSTDVFENSVVSQEFYDAYYQLVYQLHIKGKIEEDNGEGCQMMLLYSLRFQQDMSIVSQWKTPLQVNNHLSDNVEQLNSAWGKILQFSLNYKDTFVFEVLLEKMKLEIKKSIERLVFYHHYFDATVLQKILLKKMNQDKNQAKLWADLVFKYYYSDYLDARKNGENTEDIDNDFVLWFLMCYQSPEEIELRVKKYGFEEYLEKYVLWASLRMNTPHTLEYFLDKNVNVKFEEEDIRFAVENNQYQIVKLIIERGIDINQSLGEQEFVEITSNGKIITWLPITALCVAVMQGHLDMVKLLVNNEAELIPSVGETITKYHIDIIPLYAAMKNNHYYVVKYLIEHCKAHIAFHALILKFELDKTYYWELVEFMLKANDIQNFNILVQYDKKILENRQLIYFDLENADFSGVSLKDTCFKKLSFLINVTTRIVKFNQFGKVAFFTKTDLSISNNEINSTFKLMLHQLKIRTICHLNSGEVNPIDFLIELLDKNFDEPPSFFYKKLLNKLQSVYGNDISLNCPKWINTTLEIINKYVMGLEKFRNNIDAPIQDKSSQNVVKF